MLGCRLFFYQAELNDIKMGKIGLISKSAYIRGLQCPKSLYLYKNNYSEREQPSPELLVRFQQGNHFGSLAWQLFPDGKDMTPKTQYPSTLLNAAEDVRNTLLQYQDLILYEATFCYRPFICIMDMLVQQKGVLCAYEVKSSVNISPTYLNDVAYQYYVMSKAGFAPEQMNIVHLKEGVSLTENPTVEDIRITDVTPQVLDLQTYVAEQTEKLLDALQTEDTLLIQRGEQCENPYHCDFVRYCSRHEKK